ncbi:hypothetical protein QCA50_008008 [Cerrena zonata]|uniref:F-box domain-containing protein n=1 Tax=Cerrena zonata TaxID=2478898 RepID=A0AAW0G4R6_9APHY
MPDSYFEPVLAGSGERRRRFLPEIVVELVQYIRNPNPVKDPNVSLYEYTAMLRIRLSCCLVCRYWNKLFIPVLYEEILLDPYKPKLVSRLLHSLWHIKPEYKNLIRRLIVYSDKSTKGWTPILLQLPNLLSLSIGDFDLSYCHLRFPQFLNRLPPQCKTCIFGKTVRIHPSSIRRLVQFLQHTQPIKFSCVMSDDSKGRSLGEFSASLTLQIGRCVATMTLVTTTWNTSIDLVNSCLRTIGPLITEVDLELIMGNVQNLGKNPPQILCSRIVFMSL